MGRGCSPRSTGGRRVWRSCRRRRKVVAMTSPEMRASDRDRDLVADTLREHMAQGRLTVEEFNERLEQVYASKTYGELAKITADLPDIDLENLPAQRPAADRRPAKRVDKGLKAAWAAWAMASSINWVIWLL